jgi:hypothetical protein
MQIIVQNSKLQKYEALVVDFQPLPDWVFKVSYYDDEGQLTTEVVDHKRLRGEFYKE